MSDINVQTFSGKVNITSNLLVGTSHFFVDTTNNRVGITTASPSASLDVNGDVNVGTNITFGGVLTGNGSGLTSVNSDSGLWAGAGTGSVYLSTSTDNVGIGTTNPSAPLDVFAPVASGTQRTALKLTTPESTTGTGCNLDFFQNTANVGRLASVYEAAGQLGMSFSTWNSGLGERVRIDASGNVGIGTTDPDAKLHVNGGDFKISAAGGGGLYDNNYQWLECDNDASWYRLARTAKTNGIACYNGIAINQEGGLVVGSWDSPNALGVGNGKFTGTVTASTFSTTSQLYLGTSASIRQSSSAWTGDPGSGVGKIEYHSNRWYIVAGSNSTELLRVRRNNSDKFVIDNNGSISLGIVPAARISGTVASATNADTVDGQHAHEMSWGHDTLHGTYTDFNTFINTDKFGAHYVTGTTNGPGQSGPTQYYHQRMSLGSEYNNYSLQLAIGRNRTDNYLWYRNEEAGVVSSWYKMRAGYADTCGTAGSVTGQSQINKSAHSSGANDYHLELFSGNTGSSSNEVSIRFHQGSVWWGQIRFRSSQFYFTSGGDNSLYAINTGSIYNSGSLESDGRIYADNGCHVRGDWLRVNGNAGIYFESYGGGWYMTDSTYIRNYGSKMLLIEGSGARIYGLEATVNYSSSSTGYRAVGVVSDPANYSFSLYVDKSVRAAGFVAFSDRRIKSNVVDINDTYALEQVRKLKPKYYDYVDKVARGDSSVIGFIAQEVKEVVPRAVSVSDGDVPNIYETGNIGPGNTITFTKFDTSTLESSTKTLIVYLSKQDRKEVTVAEIIDKHTLRVEEDISEWGRSMTEDGKLIYEEKIMTVTPEEYKNLEDKMGYEPVVTGYSNGVDTISMEEYDALDDKTGYSEFIGHYEINKKIYEGTEIFVWGQKVNDFHHLNKDYLWTIGTAALQEVDRQLQAEKARTYELQQKVELLEMSHASLIQRIEALEKL